MFGSCPTRLTRSCPTLTRTRCGPGDIAGRSARVFKFIFDRHNHTQPSAKPGKTLTRPCRDLQPIGAKGIDQDRLRTSGDAEKCTAVNHDLAAAIRYKPPAARRQ